MSTVITKPKAKVDTPAPKTAEPKLTKPVSDKQSKRPAKPRAKPVSKAKSPPKSKGKRKYRIGRFKNKGIKLPAGVHFVEGSPGSIFARASVIHKDGRRKFYRAKSFSTNKYGWKEAVKLAAAKLKEFQVEAKKAGW